MRVGRWPQCRSPFNELHLVVASFFVGGSGAPRFVPDARINDTGVAAIITARRSLADGGSAGQLAAPCPQSRTPRSAVTASRPGPGHWGWVFRPGPAAGARRTRGRCGGRRCSGGCLTIDDVIDHDGQLFIRLGGPGPGPRTLCRDADRGGSQPRDNEHRRQPRLPWLFPGGHADRPFTPDALVQQFRAPGAAATQTRTAAFRQLLLQAPSRPGRARRGQLMTEALIASARIARRVAGGLLRRQEMIRGPGRWLLAQLRRRRP